MFCPASVVVSIAARAVVTAAASASACVASCRPDSSAAVTVATLLRDPVGVSEDQLQVLRMSTRGWMAATYYIIAHHPAWVPKSFLGPVHKFLANRLDHSFEASKVYILWTIPWHMCSTARFPIITGGVKTAVKSAPRQTTEPRPNITGACERS